MSRTRMVVAAIVLVGVAIVAYLALRPTRPDTLANDDGGPTDGSKTGRSIMAIGGGLTSTVAAIADASASGS